MVLPGPARAGLILSVGAGFTVVIERKPSLAIEVQVRVQDAFCDGIGSCFHFDDEEGDRSTAQIALALRGRWEGGRR